MKYIYFTPTIKFFKILSSNIVYTSAIGEGKDFSGDEDWANNSPKRQITKDDYENN